MAEPKNQHYVPRFILRNFLTDNANKAKEQVSVYDKHRDKTFVTSIMNIMAENRFHDFLFENWLVSFEPAMTRLEGLVLPTYRRIVENRRLDRSAEERGELAFLLAFQFARTKASRDRAAGIEGLLKEKLEATGQRIEDLEGWEPRTEDMVKRDDIMMFRDMLPGFTLALTNKDFLLAEAAPGRSFYLGDNPVCLNNTKDFGPYGNIGLAVPGIEIYLPLTSELLLCPSILKEIRENAATQKRDAERQMLDLLMKGRISADGMREGLEAFRAQRQHIERLLSAVGLGEPIDTSPANMDYYNSLQSSSASRYVVRGIALETPLTNGSGLARRGDDRFYRWV